MQTRQQARVENHEVGEDEIVYDVFEERDVDDLFQGYTAGTKIILLAMRSSRESFFQLDKRGRDGGLITRGPDPNVEFRNFVKRKTGYISKTFYEVAEAKAFAKNPNVEKERRKNRAVETENERERKTQQNAMRLDRQPDCREGRPGETFWRRRYEGSVYAHFPNLGEGATEEQKTWQSEFFKQIGCDARKEVPSKNLYGKVKNDDHLTYAFRVNKYNLTKVAKETLIDAHHVFRQVYNATIFFIKQRDEERFEAKKDERVPPPSYEKQELRELVYGTRKAIAPTPGMMNCAEHIASDTSLADTAEIVQKSWKEVPSRVREDAVEQAWMAWKSNLQKIQKQKDENPHAVIKPFNLSYRKFSQPSVINLPKEEVLMRFVQAEKKARAVRVEEVEADEQMEQAEEMEETEQTRRADAKKKKRKEKKKRDRERRKQKRESARLLNPPPQPPPRRAENSPNKRAHFFAEFSQYGWCRKMKVVEENAPVKFGIRLCDSKKILDQILENNCEKVVQTRLRYNPKTKEHFIDAVIKVPKVSEDKEGEIIVGGTDVGNEPFCTFYSGSTGECFNEIILGKDDEKINGSRILLFSKKEKRVTELEEQLEKMSWTEHKRIQTEQKRANPRTRKQWCQARRNLKKRLEKARVSLRNYRKKFHYLLGRKAYEKHDVLVNNKLDSKRIYEESKETHDGFGTTARKNAAILAQASFAEVLKHIARRTPGKKYISGAGERGTSKTCCYCYKWKPKLGWAKEYRCSNARCRKVYDRDAGSAKNNTMERAQYEKAREEAAEIERQVAERVAAEAAERAEAEAAEAAEERRRSLRQRRI